MKFIHLILLIICTNLNAQTNITGVFNCTNAAMVDEISKRETRLEGKDVWNISVNGKTGVIISPTGVKELLSFQKSIIGPKASGDLYIVKNSQLLESIQIMIDNVPNGSGKSTLITKFKVLSNIKMLTIGFCTS